MIAVHLDRVSYTHATLPIFTGLSLEIHDDRCMGLVGPNGSGKSTLLRLIAGELACDEGKVIRLRGMKIGYLAQDPCLEPENSLWEEVFSASEELRGIELELEQVEVQLGNPEVYGDEKALSRALQRQERLLVAYEKAGGPGYEGRVR